MITFHHAQCPPEGITFREIPYGFFSGVLRGITGLWLKSKGNSSVVSDVLVCVVSVRYTCPQVFLTTDPNELVKDFKPHVDVQIVLGSK